MKLVSTLFLVVPALLAALAGCSNDPVGNPGPPDIPFELMIPGNRPAADYYATSGIVTTRRLVKVGDSLVESSVPSFYAQFNTASPSIPVPGVVTLNNNPLEHNRGTDTLRLDEASAGSNILGDNTWAIGDSGGTPSTFTLVRVDVVDSVTPFDTRGSIRSDTALAIRWKRPSLGTASSGMYMIWQPPGKAPYMQSFDDGAGGAMLDTALLKGLRGRGSVTFLRYYTLDRTYKGKRMILQRIAQRSYAITVD